MQYAPHTEEEYALIGGQMVKGHTDFGLLTILFPQIVNGLQVSCPCPLPSLADVALDLPRQALTLFTYIRSKLHRASTSGSSTSRITSSSTCVNCWRGGNAELSADPSSTRRRKS